MKCKRCGKPADTGRMLCGHCYSQGKIPDTVKLPIPKKGGK